MDDGSGRFLDARGLRCPLPVLKARRVLASLPDQAEITVLATDPAARIDFAHLCNIEGYTLVSVGVENDVLRFQIRKGL